MTAPWDKALWQDVLAGGLRPGPGARCWQAAPSPSVPAHSRCSWQRWRDSKPTRWPSPACFGSHNIAAQSVFWRAAGTAAASGCPAAGSNLPDAEVSAVRRAHSACTRCRAMNSLDMLSTIEPAAVRGWQLVDGRFLDAGCISPMQSASRGHPRPRAPVGLARGPGGRAGRAVRRSSASWIRRRRRWGHSARAGHRGAGLERLPVPESVAPDWVSAR